MYVEYKWAVEDFVEQNKEHYFYFQIQFKKK